MATGTVKSLVSTLNSNCTKREIFTLPAKGTLTITGDNSLSNAYILTIRGTNANAYLIIMGTGYGATTTRHKITTLMDGNTYFSVSVSDTTYGLIITSTYEYPINVVITKLGIG